MPDALSGLAELVQVADHQSFTRAAAALRVTPSALSQKIRALEERVGVRLLQRTTRSVGLTEEGARLIARLKPALAEVDAALHGLSDERERPSGTLRLSLPRIGYQHVLQPQLVSFLAAYPDITLDIAIDDGFVDIVAGGFDAGMRLGEAVEREMIALRVSEPYRMAVVGSPAYFATHKRPKHPKDLVDHDCIGYRMKARGVVTRWYFHDRRELSVAVDGRLMVNDGDFMVAAAIDGVGLAYVMEHIVRAELADKRLVRVLEAYCPPFDGMTLYYPSRAQLAPKLQALVDHLRPKRRQRGV